MEGWSSYGWEPQLKRNVQSPSLDPITYLGAAGVILISARRQGKPHRTGMMACSIAHGIVVTMTMTSMQIDSKVRDELASVAESDFHGASLGEAVKRLVKEHKINRIMQRYEELRADPQEWASYQAEARLTDNAAGDRLPDAREEYPEYNQ